MNCAQRPCVHTCLLFSLLPFTPRARELEGPPPYAPAAHVFVGAFAGDRNPPWQVCPPLLFPSCCAKLSTRTLTWAIWLFVFGSDLTWAIWLFVFGSDLIIRLLTSIFFLSGVHVYTHVFCWVRPWLKSGVITNGILTWIILRVILYKIIYFTWNLL
jgi:hypothetical protein